jgi:hypothetical protein
MHNSCDLAYRGPSTVWLLRFEAATPLRMTERCCKNRCLRGHYTADNHYAALTSLYEELAPKSKKGNGQDTSSVAKAALRIAFIGGRGVLTNAKCCSFCRPIWKVSRWLCSMLWEREFACQPAIFPRIVNWWTDLPSLSGRAIGMTWNACCDC